MPNSSYSEGWRTTVYATAQTALKTIAADSPAAADALRVIAFNVDAKAPIGPRQDAHGSAGRRAQINQHRTVSWSLECYATGGGATGTAADWHQLFTAGGWTANTPPSDTTVSGGSSTTTRIDVASSSGWEAGDAVVVNNELRRVTAVDSVGTDLVVTPPLSAAPAASDNVKAAYIYHPNDGMADSQDALTLWGFDNRRCDRVIGAVVTSIAINASGSEDLRMTFEGSAYRADILHSTLLNGSIDNSTTTVTVDSGLCVPSDVSSSAPVYMQVDSEVLKIIGVSGNDLTTDTRGVYLTGGAAASHSDNAELYPYEPTPSYVSVDPISRTLGELQIAQVDLEHQSASISVDLGVRFTEANHGEAYSIGHYTLNRREVTFAAEGSSEYSTMGVRALEAHNRTEVQAFVMAGNAEGSLIAWECPKVVFENPTFNRARDDEMSYSMSGPAHESTSAEDDVFVMVG